MKTLKEMAEMYSPVMSDMEIIQTYFIENNLETEALKLVVPLAEMKSNKIQQQLNYARTWVPNIMTPRTSDRGLFDKETEKHLMSIIQYHMLSKDLPDWLLEWAKENIPNIKTPAIFFQPAKEWLEQKYGIKFKEKEAD